MIEYFIAMFLVVFSCVSLVLTVPVFCQICCPSYLLRQAQEEQRKREEEERKQRLALEAERSLIVSRAMDAFKKYMKDQERSQTCKCCRPPPAPAAATKGITDLEAGDKLCKAVVVADDH